MNYFRTSNYSFFFLILSCKIFTAPLNIQVDAQSAILINAESGAVLYQKNAHQPMYPASTTKIATALYALEKAGQTLDSSVVVLDDHVKIVSPALKKQTPDIHPSYRLEYGSTCIGLKAGDRLPLKVMLYGLMLHSGNDAANAIAYHLSGNIPAFMQEVNNYFLSKNISNTTFNNPHGLHNDQHLTTASDLAKITVLALKNPLFKEIVGTKKILRPNNGGQGESYFVQYNKLLKPGQFYYPKAIGVKTGYHSKAGFNLVAAAEDNGRLLIAVLLKCKDSDSRYRDAINLFEAAFKEKKTTRTLLAKEQDIFKRELPKAQKALEAILKEDLTLTYYPSEEPQMKASLLWKDVALPIGKGDVVGEMIITSSEGAILTKSPVYALKSVEKTSWATTIDWLDAKKSLLVRYKLNVILAIALFVLTLSLFLKRGAKKLES